MVKTFFFSSGNLEKTWESVNESTKWVRGAEAQQMNWRTRLNRATCYWASQDRLSQWGRISNAWNKLLSAFNLQNCSCVVHCTQQQQANKNYTFSNNGLRVKTKGTAPLLQITRRTRTSSVGCSDEQRYLTIGKSFRTTATSDRTAQLIIIIII